MKPYYKISKKTEHIIIELVNKCRELDLGNISFSLYPLSGEVIFTLDEYKEYWSLVVGRNEQRDIYKIVDGILIYNYSETNY